MVLSKRERLIAILTLAALGIVVGDHYVLGPILARYDALAVRRTTVEAELAEAGQLRTMRDRLAGRWQGLRREGLRDEPADTESLVMHAVRDWSSHAGFDLASLRPERTRPLESLREVTFRVSGTGSMLEVTRFLYQLETSRLPLRIVELQLGSRTEGVDDLSLQVKLSALCMPEAEQSASTDSNKVARQ